MDKRLNVSDFNYLYLGRLGECIHSDDSFTIACDVAHLPFFDKMEQFDFSLVVLCKQGRLDAVLNGVRYTATKGDLLFCSGMHTVTEAMISTDFLCDLFCMSVRKYHEITVPDRETIGNFLFAYSSPLISLTDSEMQIVLGYEDLMRRKADVEKSSYSQRILNSLAQAMILEFMSACEKRNLPAVDASQRATGIRHKLVHDFLILLSEDFSHRHSVKYYADKLCVSPKYLTQVVKVETGKTVSKWIKEQLTEQIRHLLLNTSLSCKEISTQLGFPNNSFFGKFTKAHLGNSPMLFRSRQGGGQR
ncbi:MAG: helix-turn-helix domain-containing protein [Prevotella sp.]